MLIKAVQNLNIRNKIPLNCSKFTNNVKSEFNEGNYSQKIDFEQSCLSFCGQSQIIQKQSEKSVIDKINSLSGDAFENANEIKNIILESVGLPKDCIQVEVFDIPVEGHYCDYFNYSTGNILVHRNDNVDIKKLAKIIRHEIEHFKQALAISKHLGADFYKELFCNPQIDELKSVFPTASTEFKKELWENPILQDKVKIPRARVEQYVAHTKIRMKANELSDGLPKEMVMSHLYFQDPSEIDAYYAGNSLYANLM